MAAPVLVTGASGALGRAIVRALADDGRPVRALVHRRRAESRAGVEEVRADLRGGDLTPAVAGAAAVVHCAAVTHARRTRRYEEVNVGGTDRLAAAAAAEGVRRFVHVSSRAAAPRGGGAYSLTKHRSEEVVRGRLGDATVVRLPELYGPEVREGLGRIVDQALRGAPIPVVGDGGHRVAPVLLEDVVGPLLAAIGAERARGRLYTLAGEATTVRRFAEACVSAFGSSSRIVPLPRAVVALAGRAGRVLPLPVHPDQLARLEVDKPLASPDAAGDLGFRPRTVAEGLREIVRGA